MIRELKSSHNYAKVMLSLSVLTLLFGSGYCFLGELLLPFAIAFSCAQRTPAATIAKPVKSFFIIITPCLFQVQVYCLFCPANHISDIHAVFSGRCIQGGNKTECPVLGNILAEHWFSGGINDRYNTGVGDFLNGKFCDFSAFKALGGRNFRRCSFFFQALFLLFRS